MNGHKLFLTFLAGVIGLSLSFSACKPAETEISTGNGNRFELLRAEVSSETDAETPQDQGGTYSFGSVSQMRKNVPQESKASVLLKGYYRANDGGGGMFYWDAESVLEPDGGLVIQAQDTEKGRYIRLCDDDYRNVKWFGASSDGNKDDTDAIQAAIDSLPPAGGTISFPGGEYLITDTIRIGNGDGGSTASNRNGVRLVGCGGGFGVYGGKEPTIIRAERKMEAMISINGKITGVALQGICFLASNMAKTCISAKAVDQLVMDRVMCKTFLECGIHLIGGKGEGNGNTDCKFETVQATTTQDNAVCFNIDSDSGSCATENCMFIDCRFDTHTTVGSKACRIENATGLSFFRCHITGYSENTSDYLVLDAAEDGKPAGHTFYDCSIARVKVIEEDGHSIGDHFFIGHGSYDLEQTPEHPKLHGITDSGLTFGFGGE